MRFKHLLTGVAVALISLGALAVAQQPGQRGGPPGGRGFPGFGGFGGFGGGFASRLGLLSIPEVRRELELADEQVEALEKIREEIRTRFPMPGFPGGRGPGGPPDGQRGRRGGRNNEALRNVPTDWFFVQAQEQQPGGRGRGGFGQLTEEQRAEFERQRRERAKFEREKLAEILLPHQLKRLTEIYIQVAGVAALQDDDIAAELGITEAQKSKMAEVQASIREEMGAQMRELFQGGGEREAIQAKMQELRRNAEAKVLAVLTPEQQKKFEEMKGKPFNMPEGFGRGGFGPGGPGGRGRGNRGGNNN